MKWILMFISLTLMAPTCRQDAAQRLRFGISYAKVDPSQLYNYGMVIIEPDHYTRNEILELKSTNTKIIAYISLGEVDPNRWYYPLLEERGFLGRNENWNSPYLNLADSVTRTILVNRVAGRIMDKSVDGLLLDTVDDVGPWTERSHLQPQMAGLIEQLHRKWPNARLIQNGGFFLLDETRDYISALMDEDVATRFDFEDRTYSLREDQAYHEQLASLQELRTEYKLPILLVEYADDPTMIERVRERLNQTDYPYFISTIELNSLPPEPPYKSSYRPGMQLQKAGGQ